jgi:hypothetical protein
MTNDSYNWNLLEYKHLEKPFSFETYIWENEPELRERIQEETGLKEKLVLVDSEWNQILKLMDWVHNLSEHQGFEEAPNLSAIELLNSVREGKITFRCVEFSHMLQHLCSAFGIPSRVIGLRRPNSHAGLGKGHVVVDVWSNDYQKWVVLDPQMNWYYTDINGLPLSIFEIHDRVREGKFEEILLSRELEVKSNFISVSAKDNTNYDSFEVPKGYNRDEVWEALPDHSDFKGFMQFWKEYYYQFTFRRIYSFNREKNSTKNQFFYYDKIEMPPLLFQGNLENNIYTSERSKIDFPVNGVEIQWTPNISQSDLRENNKLTLHFNHSMPWFDHYDVILNDKKVKLNLNVLEVYLKKSKNTITITPVNTFGRSGTTSVLSIVID